jgi:excinuclease ABC subunit C
MQFYDKVPPPKQILLSENPTVGLSSALSQKAGFPVHILSGSHLRGNKRKQMQQALQNAERSFIQNLQESKIKDETWEELRKLLQIPKLDKIEIYDNSHIQGAFAVGAMVAATKDGFQKNLYRRFNIDGTKAQTNDDFGMMKEVLQRRLSRGIREKDLPSALLIDGGKGQLSSVISILKEMDINSIAVLAIAKGEKRNAGLEVFYLGTDPNTPIYLDLKGDLIHLLQRLRDEAHRFAIGTHRAKRAKNMFHESLIEIEDIGEKRKKALMLHFGSAREIAGASIEQLQAVPGINEKIAKKVYTFYHG